MFIYIAIFVGFMGVLFFVLVLLLFYFSEGYYRKRTRFECGFQSFVGAGVSFSMPFFIISLIFLLFDVEIIIIRFPSFLEGGFCLSFWLVIFLILLATCYEWAIGVLS